MMPDHGDLSTLDHRGVSTYRQHVAASQQDGREAPGFPAPADAPDSPAAEAWRLLMSLLLGQQHERFHSVATSLGLTPAHLKALLLLDPADPQPMRGLASHMQCDASYITSIVDRLEARGYAQRRPDERDRRIRAVAMTDGGRRAQEQALRVLHEPPAELTRLPLADQELLLDLLRRAVGRPRP